MKFISKVIIVSLITIGATGSAYFLNEEKENIIQSFNSIFSSNPKISKNNDEKWANKIIKGGYILFFRHAEREKWIDVQMYDALESDLHSNGINGTRYAESDYFDKAVCLNSRGKIQAKAMGEVIKFSKLPFNYIVSSPSCRSRQTALMAFGKYDELDRALVHKGPYNENMQDRNDFLKNFLLNLPEKNGTNTLVSAHNGVISSKLFDNNIKGKLSLEEGGFYVIKKDENKLNLVYEFHNFNNFSKIFFLREYSK